MSPGRKPWDRGWGLTMTLALFALLAVMTLGGAVGVTLEPRIARLPVWMLGVLLGVVGYFLLLGSNALGVVHLLVSIGGTLLILTYGILLTAPGPNKEPRTRWQSVVVAGVTVALLAIVLLPVLAQTATTATGDTLPGTRALAGAMLDLDAGTGEKALANLPEGSTLVRPRATYLLPMLIVLVQLLVVLTGAAYLARGRHKERQP